MIDQLNLQKGHYTGACSEALAQAYFLGRGQQVYLPVVQQSCVDFLVEEGSRVLKVQVKTATWIKSGKNKYLQCRTRVTNKYQDKQPKDLYDILVIVHEGSLWVIPADEVTSSNISLENTGKNDVQWKEYRVN